MKLRLLHPSRLWVAAGTLALMHAKAPYDEFCLALDIWVLYAACFTACHVWRRRWLGFAQPTLAYIALAVVCGADMTVAFAEAWTATACVALVVHAPRLIAWLARRCLRAWRERRERRRNELHPVTVAVRGTPENIDAGEVLYRLGLSTE